MNIKNDLRKAININEKKRAVNRHKIKELKNQEIYLSKINIYINQLLGEIKDYWKCNKEFSNTINMSEEEMQISYKKTINTLNKKKDSYMKIEKELLKEKDDYQKRDFRKKLI